MPFKKIFINYLIDRNAAVHLNPSFDSIAQLQIVSFPVNVFLHLEFLKPNWLVSELVTLKSLSSAGKGVVFYSKLLKSKLILWIHVLCVKF